MMTSQIPTCVHVCFTWQRLRSQTHTNTYEHNHILSTHKRTTIHKRWGQSVLPDATHSHIHTYRQKNEGCKLPDAAHAACLRSQLASLQLGGDNLTLSLKFPGQALKLKLLGRQRETEVCVRLGEVKHCQSQVMETVYGWKTAMRQLK